MENKIKNKNTETHTRTVKFTNYNTTPLNLAILHTYLPQDIIDKISNIRLHFNPNSEDTSI